MSRSLDACGPAFASWPGLDRAARATRAGQRVRGSRTKAEFRFTDADFDAVRTLIRRRAGVALAPAKRNLVYGRLSRRLRALGVTSFTRYFEQAVTLPSGHSRVRAELRRLIEFRRLNLIEANWRIPAGLAAIFSRNVLIYFERPTQSAVLARMAALLANDGLLFAGHAENVTSACEALRPLGKTVYARADERSSGRSLKL